MVTRSSLERLSTNTKLALIQTEKVWHTSAIQIFQEADL